MDMWIVSRVLQLYTGLGDIHISKPVCGENCETPSSRDLSFGGYFQRLYFVYCSDTTGESVGHTTCTPAITSALFFAFSVVGNGGPCGLHLCSSQYVEVEPLVFLRVKKFCLFMVLRVEPSALLYPQL